MTLSQRSALLLHPGPIALSVLRGDELLEASQRTGQRRATVAIRVGDDPQVRTVEVQTGQVVEVLPGRWFLTGAITNQGTQGCRVMLDEVEPTSDQASEATS